MTPRGRRAGPRQAKHLPSHAARARGGLGLVTGANGLARTLWPPPPANSQSSMSASCAGLPARRAIDAGGAKASTQLGHVDGHPRRVCAEWPIAPTAICAQGRRGHDRDDDAGPAALSGYAEPGREVGSTDKRPRRGQPRRGAGSVHPRPDLRFTGRGDLRCRAPRRRPPHARKHGADFAKESFCAPAAAGAAVALLRSVERLAAAHHAGTAGLSALCSLNATP